MTATTTRAGDELSLVERLLAMLGTRNDRPQDKWLGDGVHAPVSVNELLAALATAPEQAVLIKEMEAQVSKWQALAEANQSLLELKDRRTARESCLSAQPGEQIKAYAVYRQRADENEGKEFFYHAMWHNDYIPGEGERIVEGWFVTAPPPASTNRLTDEQILDVAERAYLDNKDGDEREFYLKFARALLADRGSEGNRE